jgi:hypothetical protein
VPTMVFSYFEERVCAKPHLHLQRAGILALWGGSRYYWFRSWVQLVHWQQQDYTQPAKDILEVVEGHCSMCLISALRANTAGVRDRYIQHGVIVGSALGRPTSAVLVKVCI